MTLEKAETMVVDKNGVVLVSKDKAFDFHALPGSKQINLNWSERVALYGSENLERLDVSEVVEDGQLRIYTILGQKQGR